MSKHFGEKKKIKAQGMASRPLGEDGQECTLSSCQAVPNYKIGCMPTEIGTCSFKISTDSEWCLVSSPKKKKKGKYYLFSDTNCVPCISWGGP